MSVFALLDHGAYSTNIFKSSSSLIDLVEGISHVIQHFVDIKLVLCHMHKIYYCLYKLKYCRIIFN